MAETDRLNGFLPIPIINEFVSGFEAGRDGNVYMYVRMYMCV